MRRRRPVGSEEIEAVGRIEQPCRRPRMPGHAVLPDESSGRRVDREHAVVVVVVDHEDARWEELDERWVVEHAGAARRLVAELDPPAPVELDDCARVLVIGDEVAVATDLLGVRRIADREVGGPDEPP